MYSRSRSAIFWGMYTISDTRVLKGLQVRGGTVQGAGNDIADWFGKLGEIE